jgi:hypothetical protein
MRRYRPFDPGFLAMAIVPLTIVMAGCGESDDLPRQPVSGHVTFNGEPLAKAWIQFRPEGTGGITASGAMIQDGSYAVPRSEGLVPGNYRVLITKSEEPSASAIPPEAAEVPNGTSKTTKLKKGMSPFRFAKELIPAQYNMRTELKAKVEDGDTNAFDFTLTSK